MPRPNFHVVLASVVVAVVMSSCQPASTASSPSPAAASVLLLGETHDNGEGHRLRTDGLRRRLEAGWRPAIAMEQFDRQQQPALDAAMRECADAGCVISKVITAKSTWQWSFYKPVITLALQYKLPLLAANLSRADAGTLIQHGFGSVLQADVIRRYGLDTPLPAALLAKQVEEVRRGHCGMLPEDMLAPMARAQVARDVLMAETLRPHAGQGTVLIAGNGHVRRDIGVPYWLHGQGLTTFSVGYIEQAPVPGEFDDVQRIAAIARPDPCAALGKTMGRKTGG
jgi:uncharacterized iron-regulated protein